jgi:hypothetical protein
LRGPGRLVENRPSWGADPEKFLKLTHAQPTTTKGMYSPQTACCLQNLDFSIHIDVCSCLMLCTMLKINYKCLCVYLCVCWVELPTARGNEVDGAGGTCIQGRRGQIFSSPSRIWQLQACRRIRRRRRWAGLATKVGTPSLLPLCPPRLSLPCSPAELQHGTGRSSCEFGAKNSPARDPEGI